MSFCVQGQYKHVVQLSDRESLPMPPKASASGAAVNMVLVTTMQTAIHARTIEGFGLQGIQLKGY